MSPAVKGLVFAAIGVGAALITVLGILWPLMDLSGGTVATLAIIGVIFAGVFGFVTGWKEIYALEPRPIWAFIIDVTWSSINTVTGLIWMIYCAVKGSFAPPTEVTKKRGIIVFSGAALPGAAASTIGTVMGPRSRPRAASADLRAVLLAGLPGQLRGQHARSVPHRPLPRPALGGLRPSDHGGLGVQGGAGRQRDLG